VTATVPSSVDPFLRGQIELVPEPSALMVLGLAVASSGFAFGSALVASIRGQRLCCLNQSSRTALLRGRESSSALRMACLFGESWALELFGVTGSGPAADLPSDQQADGADLSIHESITTRSTTVGLP